MRSFLVVVTAVFTAFSLWVIGRTGLIGFYEQLLAGPAGWQVLADIAIALTLVLVWIWHDAAAGGKNRAFDVQRAGSADASTLLQSAGHNAGGVRCALG